MRVRKRNKTRQDKTMIKAVECARERSGGGRTSDLAFEHRRRCAKCVHRLRVLWARLAQPLDHWVAANVDANTCVSSRCHIRSRICERSMQLHCSSIRVLLCTPITETGSMYSYTAKLKVLVYTTQVQVIFDQWFSKKYFFIEFGILIIFNFNKDKRIINNLKMKYKRIDSLKNK